MSRKTKIIAAILGLVVVGGALAAVALGLGSPQLEVQVADAVVQDLAVTVMASGAVDTGLRADVFPPTSGLIVDVHVTDGARVKAGTALASLDTAPLDAAVAQARAGLAQAEAQLETLTNAQPGGDEASAARAATTAAWSGYQAALSAVDAALDGAPSSGDLAAANAATNAAWKSYDAARAAYDLLKASIETSPVPSPVALTELKAAEASRDQAYAGYLQAQASAAKLAGFSSTSATNQARAAADQAYAAYAQARAAESKLASADVSAQQAAAHAAIDQARLGVVIAESNRVRSKLIAPIDGVVLFNATGAPGSDGQTPK
ncbi:MAG: biotin/lipoyl-binding protein, partial [Coriobacteriia bacterium]